MANCNCNSSTLVINRPSQKEFDCLSASGGITATPENSTCVSGCSNTLGPFNRKIGKRKYREKVREGIKDYVLLMLGAPVVKVELDTQTLDIIVDQTLDIYEEFCGRENFDYFTFTATPGKSVYKLPDDVGVVRNVFYKQIPSFAFQASDLDGAIPIEYFYPGGAYASISGGLMDPIQPIWGRMGEWVLYKQYEQMYSRISSNIGGWEWISDTNHIKVYPIPHRPIAVIVHYLQQCKDWTKVNQAMREGALAHAMIVLGHIRGKYQQPPGPGGGMQLDGEYMKTKGWELKDAWQEKLITTWSDIPYISMD